MLAPAVLATLGRVAKPAQPVEFAPGRPLELPGRGTTCVIDLPGPPGAPAVILVHALATTAALSWYPSMSRLSEHFRVVAFDQRWHGRGIRSEEFRLADCADDVVAVADALGIDRFTVVGYSMGGAIAQLVWKRHRRRVEGLVLGATSRNFCGTPAERLWFWLTTLAMTRLGSRARLGMERLAARLSDEPTPLSAELAQLGPWAFSEFRSTSIWSMFAAIDEIGRFDSSAWIRQVDVPASVIVATRDRLIPTRRQRRLAAAIPGAMSFDIEGAHTALVLGADEFVPALVEACLSISRRIQRRAAA
ncbi:MAG TPA: alpha/beta fold hydrolase [Mycobacteriales bacterium]|nr:alpha/beta fold hydrolase [Mycobacteriales bacterium]